MNVRLVEVTRHDGSYKGTWYRIGQRHFVRQDPLWPEVMTCRWRALDVAGSINERDCRIVRGPMAWVRCCMRALRPNVGGNPRERSAAK